MNKSLCTFLRHSFENPEWLGDCQMNLNEAKVKLSNTYKCGYDIRTAKL